MPRHPPCALTNLTTKMLASTVQFSSNGRAPTGTHRLPHHHLQDQPRKTRPTASTRAVRCPKAQATLHPHQAHRSHHHPRTGNRFTKRTHHASAAATPRTTTTWPHHRWPPCAPRTTTTRQHDQTGPFPQDPTARQQPTPTSHTRSCLTTTTPEDVMTMPPPKPVEDSCTRHATRKGQPKS